MDQWRYDWTQHPVGSKLFILSGAYGKYRTDEREVIKVSPTGRVTVRNSKGQTTSFMTTGIQFAGDMYHADHIISPDRAQIAIAKTRRRDALQGVRSAANLLTRALEPDVESLFAKVELAVKAWRAIND